jgi:hypothetical protein
LAARPLALAYGLPWPSVDEILAATSASREHAHAIADAIIAALPALEQSLSPLSSEPAAARNVRLEALTREALRFVMRHPDCTQGSATTRYSARYRRFVIALRKRYADVTASEFTEALGLPPGTLEGWMPGAHHAAQAGSAHNADEPHATSHDAAQA